MEYVKVTFRECVCPGCKRRVRVHLAHDGELRIEKHFVGRSSMLCPGTGEIGLQVQKHELTMVKAS